MTNNGESLVLLGVLSLVSLTYQLSFFRSSHRQSYKYEIPSHELRTNAEIRIEKEFTGRTARGGPSLLGDVLVQAANEDI